MTREEQIRGALNLYAPSSWDFRGEIFPMSKDELQASHEGFVRGAKWADANPKQDLADLSRCWHSTYEIPSGEKPIIYETKNYKFGVLNNVDPSRWNWYVNDKYSIIIWAYADDLIPKGGDQ